MVITVTVTKTLSPSAVAALVDAMNEVSIYESDDSLPRGVAELIDAALMEEVPDPHGTVRRYFALTGKGRRVAAENLKRAQVTRWTAK